MKNVEAEKVLERIRKLLALATSPNEAEAAAAANKAQALLAKYNLTEEALGFVTDGDEFTTDNSMKTDSRPWRRNVAVAVAKMYFCTYFYTFSKEHRPNRQNGYIRYDYHSFVGERHNIEVAKMMFKYLNDTIERLAKDGAKTQPKEERSKYKSTFLEACARRVAARIAARIQELKAGTAKDEETGSTLPALLSLYERKELDLREYISQNYSLGNGRAVTRSFHSAGIRDGKAAGDRVGLDTQVGGNSSKHLLR